MKMRLLLIIAGLVIGFAVPALAQEQNTVDPEVRQQIEALFKKLDDAYNKNDLAAINGPIHAGRGSGDKLVYRRYVCRPGGNREMV
jgi:hypothetical protein